ncbi:MAG: hypothetical protein FJ088_17155, partial [Deltaproteobacteria bacterium]|nr:hypothetical protein [Deltaproteobacteria bacterium]
FFVGRELDVIFEFDGNPGKTEMKGFSGNYIRTAIVSGDPVRMAGRIVRTRGVRLNDMLLEVEEVL